MHKLDLYKSTGFNASGACINLNLCKTWGYMNRGLPGCDSELGKLASGTGSSTSTATSNSWGSSSGSSAPSTSSTATKS